MHALHLGTPDTRNKDYVVHNLHTQTESPRICDELHGEGRLLVGASGNEAEYNIHATKTLKKGDTNMKSLVEFVSNWYLTVQ